MMKQSTPPARTRVNVEGEIRRGWADDPRLRLQRIYPCELAPEEDVETEVQWQVWTERVCSCRRQPGRLHRHGVYRFE